MHVSWTLNTFKSKSCAINSFARTMCPEHFHLAGRRCVCAQAHRTSHTKRWNIANVFDSFFTRLAFCENHKLTMLCAVFDGFAHKNCLNWMHYIPLGHHSNTIQWQSVRRTRSHHVTGAHTLFGISASGERHNEYRQRARLQWIYVLDASSWARARAMPRSFMCVCWMRTKFMPLFYYLAVPLTDR